VERRPRRPGGRKPRGIASSTLPNIEWLLAEHGAITLSEVSPVDCVAAAADNDTLTIGEDVCRSSVQSIMRRDDASI